jgi:hypothetical protein
MRSERSRRIRWALGTNLRKNRRDTLLLSHAECLRALADASLFIGRIMPSPSGRTRNASHAEKKRAR